MTSDSWDDRRRAAEESFFEKQNKEALARLKSRTDSKPRLSPISGKPMEQLTIMGVVVDRCKESGGIWLDCGELEQILGNAQNPDQKSWIVGFLSGLLPKK